MRPTGPATGRASPGRRGAGRWRLPLALLLALVSAAPRSGASPPAPFEARYRVEEGDRVVGETLLTLRWMGNRYRLRSEARARGWLGLLYRDEVIEESEGEWREGRGRPLHYRYQHRRPGGGRRLTMRFDWQHNRLAITSRGETWHTALGPDVQDKLSLRLAVITDLAAGRLPEHYPVADGGPIRPWRFTIQGREELETPLGRLQTVRVLRRRPDRQRLSTSWHAIALGYLPVRIEHRDADGGRARLILESVQRTGAGETEGEGEGSSGER